MRIRRALAAFAALAALAAAVPAYLIATLDVSAHREAIEALVSRSLDREVHIDGRIDWKPSLWPRFVVGQVRVVNPTWASQPNFASVHSLAIEVGLVPLLRGKVAIRDISIAGAELHLERAPDGTPNWLFRPAAPHDRPRASLPSALSVRMAGSSVTYHRAGRPALRTQVEALDVAVAPEAPLRVRLAGAVQDWPLKLAIDGGTLAAILQDSAPWALRGVLEVAGHGFDFQGSALDITRLKQFDLAVSRAAAGSGGVARELRMQLHIEQSAPGWQARLAGTAQDIDLARARRGEHRELPQVTLGAVTVEWTAAGRQLDEWLASSDLQLAAERGEVRWRTDAASPHHVLRLESLRAQAPHGGAPVISLHGHFNDVPLRATGEFASVADWLRGEPAPAVNVSLAAAGASAQLHGTVDPPLSGAHFTGRFALRADTLHGLGRLWRNDWPATGPAQLAGTLRFDKGALSLANLDGSLAGNAFGGRLELGMTAPARLALALSARELDLPRLFGAAAAPAGPKAVLRGVSLHARGSAPELGQSLLRAEWTLAASGGEIVVPAATAGPPLMVVPGTVRAAAAPGRPLTLTLQGTNHAVPVTLDARTGTLEEWLDAKAPLPLHLSVKAPGVHAEYAGTWDKPVAALAGQGNARLHADTPAALGRIVAQDWPAQGALDATARIVNTATTVALEDLAIAMPGTRLAGRIAFDARAAPRLRLALGPGVVDVADFTVPAVPPGPGHAAGARSGQSAIPNLRFDAAPLRALDLSAQFDALHIVRGAEPLTTADGRLDIAEGRLALAPLRTRNPDGTGSETQLTIDATATPPAVALRMTIAHLDYGELLRKFAVTDRVRGTLKLSTELSGNGATLRDALADARGTLEVVGDKGRVPRWLLEVWGGGLLRVLFPLAWLEGDTTDLNCLVGRFVVADGTMRSETLLADTEEVTIVGETGVDFNNEQIRGILRPVSKHATLFRLGTPIKITGSLMEPRTEAAESGIVTLGKFALGLSNPAALVALFGDLGTREKNPCAALLERPAAKIQDAPDRRPP